MTVRELKKVIVEEVILYIQKDDDFVDLYKGDTCDIPEHLLDKKVIVVGAKRKNILDIHIEG